MHCIHIFCFIHFIIQNEFVIKRIESSFTFTHTHHTITVMAQQTSFIVSHTETEPELKTIKGRDTRLCIFPIELT